MSDESETTSTENNRSVDLRHLAAVSTHGVSFTPTFDPRIPINFIKLHPDVPTPTKGSAGAACFDIAAYLDAPVVIRPFQTALIPTGLSFRLPADCEIQVRPRSGLPNKHRVFVANSPGTVDSDYHGELMVGLYNGNPDSNFVVNNGARIAQFLVAAVPNIRLDEIVYEEPSSERGVNGFGSTGQ